MKSMSVAGHFKIPGLLATIAVVLSSAAPGAVASVRADEEPPPPQPTEPGPLIVGGGPADPGEWPWQVALVHNASGSDLFDGQFCGGSLVDPWWVVTAAHCMGGETTSTFDVVAGIYDLASPASGYQRRGISQMIVHPSFNPATFDYDIAVLKLAGPVIIGGTGETATGLIPMVAATTGSLDGDTATVTGWGNTESVPAWPDELQEVQVPIIANSLCNDSSHYDGDITDRMLCAGYEAGGYDSCQGDSGGPLMISDAGEWKLAGIVSWGVGCADPSYYGVYSRVSTLVDWAYEKLYGVPDHVSYSNDFSAYAAGAPPGGWIQRGTTEITPVVEEVGGSGASHRLVSFPEVPWQYWDKWLLKTGLSITGSYTVGVQLNFQNSVADRAGITVAWDDSQMNRIDIQPNVYGDDIEFRVTYAGPLPSDVHVTSTGTVPIEDFTDYWLKAEAIDREPGQDQINVYWSTDGTNFSKIITATGLATVAGQVGISSAGPHLPHVHFDDFHIASGTYAYRTVTDFDADFKTDTAVFEKATGNWFVVGSSSGFLAPALNFGNATDYIPVPGDYDGDGATDAAVFQRATGNWFAVGSTDGFFTPALGFGNDTDYIPVPGDYDGDGKTDAAVFQKATGHWFVVGSTDGFFAPALSFGNDTDYIPVPGDYDGDGKTDPAVFQKSTGNWFVVGSTAGFMTPALNFGNDTNYIPVPGDYDGDGKTDPAVFERSSGNWFVVGSTDGFFAPALNFGNDTSYIPQPGDYDGDGRSDPAVFERLTGNWFVVGSNFGFFTPALGFGNDTSYIPVVK